MTLSQFTALSTYLIPERSEATPGLWNNPFSVLSQNLDQLNSDLSSFVGRGSVGTTESILGFSSNTLRAESGNTIAALAALSTNTVIVQSGNTLQFFAPVVTLSNVSFETPPGWVFVDAFGAKGDGVTDDTAAIQKAENFRPKGSVLKFTAGKTYLVCSNFTSGAVSNLSTLLLCVNGQGAWNYEGAVLKYGSAVPLITSGGDGGAYGLINVLQGSANSVQGSFELRGGTLDGANLVRSVVAVQDQCSGVGIYGEIKNLNETTSPVWDGTQCTVSGDISGVSIGNSGASRAKMIYGLYQRPSCPMTPDGLTIANHVDVSVTMLGGTAINNNHTSQAVVVTDNPYPIAHALCGVVGVPQFVFSNKANIVHGDISVCDVNNNCLETQGFVLANAWSSVTTVGHMIKNGAVSGWFDYNVVSTNTRAPNVRIQGGSAQSKGLIEIIGPIRASDDLFPASVPSYAFLSEVSLGWYRSANSTMALSYGTLRLPSDLSLVGVGLISAASDIITQFGQLRGSRLSTDLGLADRAFSNTNWVRFQASTITTENVIITLFNYGTAPAGVWSQSFGALNGNITPVEYARVGGRIDSNTSGSHTGALLFSVARAGAIVPTATLNSLGQFSVVTAGQAIAPALAYSSESSLGWYRSAASVMALSYGGLGIKAGTNASFGTAVLGSNGSVNVATNYVAAGDVVFLTDQSPGGTLGDIELGGIRAGSGFTIQSTSVTDTSTVAWLIVRPT